MKKQSKLFTFLAAITATFTSLLTVYQPVSAEEAESPQQSLYRCFIYVQENTYPAKINANISYNPDRMEYYNHGTGCMGLDFIDGTFNVSNVEITDSQKITYINYINLSPNEKHGGIGFIDFFAYSQPSDFAVTTLKNDRGNDLSPDLIHTVYSLLGDVNCDGVVDMTDVEFLNRTIAGSYMPSRQGFINADIDGNGEISLDDTLDLLKIMDRKS